MTGAVASSRRTVGDAVTARRQQTRDDVHTPRLGSGTSPSLTSRSKSGTRISVGTQQRDRASAVDVETRQTAGRLLLPSQTRPRSPPARQNVGPWRWHQVPETACHQSVDVVRTTLDLFNDDSDKRDDTLICESRSVALHNDVSDASFDLFENSGTGVVGNSSLCPKSETCLHSTSVAPSVAQHSAGAVDSQDASQAYAQFASMAKAMKTCATEAAAAVNAVSRVRDLHIHRASAGTNLIRRCEDRQSEATLDRCFVSWSERCRLMRRRRRLCCTHALLLCRDAFPELCWLAWRGFVAGLQEGRRETICELKSSNKDEGSTADAVISSSSSTTTALCSTGACNTPTNSHSNKLLAHPLQSSTPSFAAGSWGVAAQRSPSSNGSAKAGPAANQQQQQQQQEQEHRHLQQEKEAVASASAAPSRMPQPQQADRAAADAQEERLTIVVPSWMEEDTVIQPDEDSSFELSQQLPVRRLRSGAPSDNDSESPLKILMPRRRACNKAAESLPQDARSPSSEQQLAQSLELFGSVVSEPVSPRSLISQPSQQMLSRTTSLMLGQDGQVRTAAATGGLLVSNSTASVQPSSTSPTGTAAGFGFGFAAPCGQLCMHLSHPTSPSSSVAGGRLLSLQMSRSTSPASPVGEGRPLALQVPWQVATVERHFGSTSRSASCSSVTTAPPLSCAASAPHTPRDFVTLPQNAVVGAGRGQQQASLSASGCPVVAVACSASCSPPGACRAFAGGTPSNLLTTASASSGQAQGLRSPTPTMQVSPHASAVAAHGHAAQRWR
eukprot:TRINITY_DN8137_c0_g1_i2.p1 TRINITY_DN8137_c0_g1~~TRINITY_DN8137_c0_g1_i2.p1  ORF type:complete len:784 (+),score=118.17 TRINITY_DN8137_c0_g1_i2:103-2454(+)